MTVSFPPSAFNNINTFFISSSFTNITMNRGSTLQYRAFAQFDGKEFSIFVDNPDAVSKWATDNSVPLAQVVSSFGIFTK